MNQATLKNEDILAEIHRRVIASGLSPSLFGGQKPGQEAEVKEAVRQAAGEDEKLAERITSTCTMLQMRGFLLLRVPGCKELYEQLLENNKGIIADFFQQTGKEIWQSGSRRHAE